MNPINTIFPYEMPSNHVSGKYWLIDGIASEMISIMVVAAGEFKVGVNGKPTALEIRLSPEGVVGDGTVLFERGK